MKNWSRIADGRDRPSRFRTAPGVVGATAPVVRSGCRGRNRLALAVSAEPGGTRVAAGSESLQVRRPRTLLRLFDVELYLLPLFQIRAADVLHVEEDVLVRILSFDEAVTASVVEKRNRTLRHYEPTMGERGYNGSGARPEKRPERDSRYPPNRNAQQPLGPRRSGMRHRDDPTVLAGTLVADAATVYEEGALVVRGDTVAAAGPREEVLDGETPDYECDVLAPGLVGGHVHSVQSLGRGIADDVELLEWLYDHVLPMEASMGAEEVRVAAELGYLELVESGTTTCVDHLTVAHAEEAFEAAGRVGVRGLLGKVLMDRDSPAGLRESTDEALAETERLLERYHGAFDDRIRYAVTPRFAVTCTEACLRGAREIADAREGVRLHTHASENRGEIERVEEETGMRNVHWLDEVGLTGEDVVLAHCVWTDDAEREVLAETGTHVTHCPSSNMKLASGVAPVADYLDRGINVALGNDGPPCNNTLDAFTEMRQASLLQKVDRLDPTVLPAATLFEMATLNGARAAGFDRVGKLREGWRADVVGLRTDRARATPVHDVLSHLVFAAHGDDVALTMVDGEVLMADGEVRTVDAERVRREATRLARQYG